MSNRNAPRNALSAPDIRDVPVFVYALCDPTSGEVRYVGRSANPQSRLSSHLAQSSERVTSWIAELRAVAALPSLRILREVPPGEDSASAERLAIGEHIARGARLLNVHGGNNRRGLQIGFVPTNLGAAAMVDLGVSQTRLAEQLNCDQSQIHHWMRGTRLPSAQSRAVLEDSLGIYWRLWDQPVIAEQAEGAA